MILRSEILKEHSRAQTEKIAIWIGTNGKRFASLLQLFLHYDYRVVQRSAWVISVIADKHPELLKPHLELIIGRMNDSNLPTAVKRNVVRLLQEIEIPESLQGHLMDSCFQFLADPNETIATRCSSMTVLQKLSNIYPDIRQELKTIIEECLQQAPSAGFRARARKVLSTLQ